MVPVDQVRSLRPASWGWRLRRSCSGCSGRGRGQTFDDLADVVVVRAVGQGGGDFAGSFVARFLDCGAVGAAQGLAPAAGLVGLLAQAGEDEGARPELAEGGVGDDFAALAAEAVGFERARELAVEGAGDAVGDACARADGHDQCVGLRCFRVAGFGGDCNRHRSLSSLRSVRPQCRSLCIVA
ncbi:MAG: hypothetical protein U0841_03570 [Chloroflexia bacterium]